MEQTPFTVEKLLQLPIMQDAKLVGGFEGTVNEILCVDIMEIPDITGWLRKGEFVLTTGYSFQDNPQGLCRVLEEIHHVDGAAVGFKPKRFLQATPPDAIELSNMYGIPLIEIPSAIPYIEITQPIMEQILNSQLTMMREVYNINSRFVTLLATQRSQELLNVLGQLLGCEAALLTFNGDVQMRTAGFTVDDVKMVRNIRSGNTAMAYVALTRTLDLTDAFETMCLDQVVALMSLELTAKDAHASQGKRVREEFLVELLSGSLRMEGILVQRANQLDFPQGLSRVVMVMEPLEDQPGNMSSKDRVQSQVADWINQTHRTVFVAASVGDHVVLLFASSESNPVTQQQIVRHMVTTLQVEVEERFGLSMRVAIGEARQDLRDVGQSYEEARRAMSVCKKVRPDLRVVHWSDIYVEDMLLTMGPHPTLDRLYTSLISPIHAYDLENGTDLLRTLDIYLQFGGNTKQVAAAMFIHRNSVHYRLERIQDILGRDLNDPELSFRLNLTLRAWKLGLGRSN
ncbi:PucR family transcriptional regulator [Alicyclobacillus dauci]|uniref:PucR family transcriptional regulator ligand-binding domain-containing protein n=1 Tax=Alicyclobacillus dauci TaxID=1475485 RepID=A0ABY6Z2H4_9BACL|nr:PucR family transcriptional regulator [Alicyclobacillus dauci]WAH37103.1 PucR family transcriptional regulator ligand-binding domain-containing protein [Alicyclobacillus dauci]